MTDFSHNFTVRWAEIDANRHMRHSAYYDFAAQLRVQLLEAVGMGIDELAKRQIGPVLFREEAQFKREIGMNNFITVNVKLQKSREDGSRWTFQHEIRREDGELAAIVTVDGAWLDLSKRRLTQLPDELLKKVLDFPRTSDFQWI